MIKVHYSGSAVASFTEQHVDHGMNSFMVAETLLTKGYDPSSYRVSSGMLYVRSQAALDLRDLRDLQAFKKHLLNKEVKRRVKIGVLADSDKALSVGLGIYDAAIPGLSQQAKDWTAAHIAASNVVQLQIFDPAATIASVTAIDSVNDPVWPDIANYQLLLS